MIEPVYDWVKERAAEGTLPSILGHTFMIRGILAALLAGPLLGLVGPLVLSKRLAFFSTTLGHASVTGLSLAILLGEPIERPYGGLFGFCLATALAMGYLRNRSNLSSDTVVGVFGSFVLGLGICLLVAATRRFDIHRIQAILFGDLLTLTDLDLALLAAVFALGSGFFVATYDRHLLAAVDPDLAASSGIDVLRLDYLFLTALTLVIVVSLKLIGAFLVEALIVIPAAAARNLSGSLRSWVLLSVLFATVGAAGGLVVTSVFPVPSGGAIVLVLSALFALTLVARIPGRSPA